MIHLTFSPSRSDRQLRISKSGYALLINGELLDFTQLPDGATLPSGAVNCEWIIGPVSRVGSVLYINVRLPIPAIPDPPPESARVVTDPEPVVIVDDGVINLPVWSADNVD